MLSLSLPAPVRVAAAIGAASALIAGLATPTPATAATSGLLAPADGVYSATITRTEYGIPHIEAEDFGSLGFGQGYGAAQDIICSLADTLLTGRGERSKYFGPEGRYSDSVTLDATNLQTDTLFGDIINRGAVEELLASDDPGIAPGDEVRAMIEGYVAGANAYLVDVGGADGITDPACSGEQFIDDLFPVEPIDLYRGIYAANLLASTGVFVPEIVEAAPPSPDDPVLPTATVGNATVIDMDTFDAKLGRGEHSPFGSNGTALSGDITDTGRGMVLGNPHFPWQGRYRFTQTQLTIPGVYDVSGGMLHGSPVVNIGWTDDIAWTHTVSTAYRFTPYQYQLVDGQTTYVTEDGDTELEPREVVVEIDQNGGTVTEDLWRTNEGYVFEEIDGSITGDANLIAWTPQSFWALRDANAEHLKTLDVFHEMAKATTVQELHDAQIETMGIPWVNTMAADRDGNILYADNSVTPHVTDELAATCNTASGQILFDQAGLPGLNGSLAQSECAWGSDGPGTEADDAPRQGIFGAANLPDTLALAGEDNDPTWVINANDSYWLPNPDAPLTGFDRIIGCEDCERSLRTRMVYRYVLDRLDGTDELGGANEFTHQQLMDIETVNRVFAAELAREGDALQATCSNAVATLGVSEDACTALEAWDGMTDVDSRGAILFREFWNNVTGIETEYWMTPFNEADPVATPNTLISSNPEVVQAFADAVSELDDEGIAYDARLGSQQKAADDGAGDIEIHGGFGSTGNANVIAIENPNEAIAATVKYPVSYGSSHIQAVAFTDAGVDACTILTYSQSTNGASDHHDDQTELWSNEEWVCWPDDVQAAAIESMTIAAPADSNGVDGTTSGTEDAAVAGDGDDLAATGGGSTLALLGLALAGVAALGRRRRTA